MDQAVSPLAGIEYATNEYLVKAGWCVFLSNNNIYKILPPGTNCPDKAIAYLQYKQEWLSISRVIKAFTEPTSYFEIPYCDPNYLDRISEILEPYDRRIKQWYS